MCADEQTARKTIDSQISALSHPKSEVRDKAAETLRTILSKSGGIPPGDKDETYWAKTLRSIKIGMSKAEVEKMFSAKQEMQPTLGQGMGSYSVSQRLDNKWEATLCFDQSNKIYSAPQLRKNELSIYVPPSSNYTGKWRTYFVNGQKSHEIDFKNGKYNGIFTSYYASGKKCYEQHYVDGVIDGTDEGWHQNGKQSYTGRYKNGKQDGLWIWVCMVV